MHGGRFSKTLGRFVAVFAFVSGLPWFTSGVPLLDKGSGISKSHLRPTTENFAFFGRSMAGA